ncbi:hypothetical protein AGLY_010009 [Aphis glycines]|uniref:Uncharacterized protein n=1 Tax=Aphis glycines TaxID=307491 RepID=A0A6G0TH19_APHGL|nr:hypothetical protein AGLY_010009 [Aphis glycines]
MLHSSGSRLERQTAESAIGWWWPAVAEVDGNEIAAHLAGPARKTSSSQAVSLLFARDDTAFELYNTIKVVALAAFKSKYYVRQQNNFALRPAVLPVDDNALLECLVTLNRASKYLVGQVGEINAQIHSAKAVANIHRPISSMSMKDKNVGNTQAYLPQRSAKLSRDFLKSLYRSSEVISTCGPHFMIRSQPWSRSCSYNEILTSYDLTKL